MASTRVVVLLAATSIEFAAAPANAARYSVTDLGKLVDVMCAYAQIADELVDPELSRSELDFSVSERLANSETSL